MASGPPSVRITNAPARFAPRHEPCRIAYAITGHATSARLEVKRRGGAVVARVASIPHATGGNHYDWNGRLDTGGWADPHISPLELTVHLQPRGASAPRSVSVEVDSVRVSYTQPNARHPERVYKGSSGDPEVELTAVVKLKRSRGAAVVARTPVGVDWTFEAARTNAPTENGGKDQSSWCFTFADGFPNTLGDHAFARNFTNEHGESKVKLVASRIAGDKYTLIARVLQDPVHRNGRVLATARTRQLVVWKRLIYEHLYQIPSGVNVSSISRESSVQSVFTPAFTEYHRGGAGVQTVSASRFTGEHLVDLVPPTAAQLPALGRLRVKSDGNDTRTITVHGKERHREGGRVAGTRDATDTLRLNGTSEVVGRKEFQVVTGVTISGTSRERAVQYYAPAVGSLPAMWAPLFARGSRSADGNALPVRFDGDVSNKAQAWVTANWTRISSVLRALRSATTTQYCLIGARYLHPKHRDGQRDTSFYAGYETSVRAQAHATSFSADACWGVYLGWNLDHMSLIFRGGSSSLAQTVARHEIAHASDHTRFRARGNDHCPERRCLMAEFDGRGQFCTSGTNHTRKRVMGWTNL